MSQGVKVGKDTLIALGNASTYMEPMKWFDMEQRFGSDVEHDVEANKVTIRLRSKNLYKILRQIRDGNRLLFLTLVNQPKIKSLLRQTCTPPEVRPGHEFFDRDQIPFRFGPSDYNKSAVDKIAKEVNERTKKIFHGVRKRFQLYVIGEHKKYVVERLENELAIELGIEQGHFGLKKEKIENTEAAQALYCEFKERLQEETERWIKATATYRDMDFSLENLKKEKTRKQLYKNYQDNSMFALGLAEFVVDEIYDVIVEQPDFDPDGLNFVRITDPALEWLSGTYSLKDIKDEIERVREKVGASKQDYLSMVSPELVNKMLKLVGVEDYQWVGISAPTGANLDLGAIKKKYPKVFFRTFPSSKPPKNMIFDHLIVFPKEPSAPKEFSSKPYNSILSLTGIFAMIVEDQVFDKKNTSKFSKFLYSYDGPFGIGRDNDSMRFMQFKNAPYTIALYSAGLDFSWVPKKEDTALRARKIASRRNARAASKVPLLAQAGLDVSVTTVEKVLEEVKGFEDAYERARAEKYLLDKSCRRGVNMLLAFLWDAGDKERVKDFHRFAYRADSMDSFQLCEYLSFEMVKLGYTRAQLRQITQGEWKGLPKPQVLQAALPSSDRKKIKKLKEMTSVFRLIAAHQAIAGEAGLSFKQAVMIGEAMKDLGSDEEKIAFVRKISEALGVEEDVLDKDYRMASEGFPQESQYSDEKIKELIKMAKAKNKKSTTKAKAPAKKSTTKAKKAASKPKKAKATPKNTAAEFRAHLEKKSKPLALDITRHVALLTLLQNFNDGTISTKKVPRNRRKEFRKYLEDLLNASREDRPSVKRYEKDEDLAESTMGTWAYVLDFAGENIKGAEKYYERTENAVLDAFAVTEFQSMSMEEAKEAAGVVEAKGKPTKEPKKTKTKPKKAPSKPKKAPGKAKKAETKKKPSPFEPTFYIRSGEIDPGMLDDIKKGDIIRVEVSEDAGCQFEILGVKGNVVEYRDQLRRKSKAKKKELVNVLKCSWSDEVKALVEKRKKQLEKKIDNLKTAKARHKAQKELSALLRDYNDLAKTSTSSRPAQEPDIPSLDGKKPKKAKSSRKKTTRKKSEKWVDGSVRIATYEDGKTTSGEEVPGFLLDGIGIFEEPGGDWTLVHASSGLRLHTLSTEKEAKLVGETLLKVGDFTRSKSEIEKDTGIETTLLLMKEKHFYRADSRRVEQLLKGMYDPTDEQGFLLRLRAARIPCKICNREMQRSQIGDETQIMIKGLVPYPDEVRVVKRWEDFCASTKSNKKRGDKMYDLQQEAGKVAVEEMAKIMSRFPKARKVSSSSNVLLDSYGGYSMKDKSTLTISIPAQDTWSVFQKLSGQYKMSLDVSEKTLFELAKMLKLVRMKDDATLSTYASFVGAKMGAEIVAKKKKPGAESWDCPAQDHTWSFMIHHDELDKAWKTIKPLLPKPVSKKKKVTGYKKMGVNERVDAIEEALEEILKESKDNSLNILSNIHLHKKQKNVPERLKAERAFVDTGDEMLWRSAAGKRTAALPLVAKAVVPISYYTLMSLRNEKSRVEKDIEALKKEIDIRMSEFRKVAGLKKELSEIGKEMYLRMILDLNFPIEKLDNVLDASIFLKFKSQIPSWVILHHVNRIGEALGEPITYDKKALTKNVQAFGYLGGAVRLYKQEMEGRNRLQKIAENQKSVAQVAEVDDERNKEIAKEIMGQLAGSISNFRKMTGAKKVHVIENGVKLAFPNKLRSKANMVEIELKDELYTMRFYRRRKVDGIPESKLMEEISMLYGDQLHEIFTAKTGLDLTVPKVVMK